MLYPYWIKTINNSKIGISPRPEGFDLLRKDIDFISKEGVTMLVSALTEDEVRRFGLKEEKSICEDLGIEFHNFPIIDHSIPKSYKKFVAFIDLLYSKTMDDHKILIHCYAGIGRSGLLALAIMLKHGEPLRDSMALGFKARGIKVPETDSQRNLLAHYAQNLP